MTWATAPRGSRPSDDAPLAVILAEEPDRRVQEAVEFAATIRVLGVRALHLAFDSRSADSFACRWVASPLSSIPATVVESDRRDLAATARRALVEMSGAGRMIVLVPVLVLPRAVDRLLHRSWVTDVAEAAARLPDTVIGTVPVPVTGADLSS